MRRIFRLSSNPPSLLPQRESGSLLTVIIMKIGVFILMRDPGKAIRNYYENRLFSFSCVVLEEHPQFSPQWESRVLFPIQPGSCLQECSSWDVNLSTRRVLETISKHPSWPPIPGWAKIKVMVRDTDPSS